MMNACAKHPKRKATMWLGMTDQYVCQPCFLAHRKEFDRQQESTRRRLEDATRRTTAKKKNEPGMRSKIAGSENDI